MWAHILARSRYGCTGNHAVDEVFYFGPNNESFALCQFNLWRNGCDHAQPINQALGGTTLEDEMWLDTGTHARNTLHRRATSSERTTKVQVIGLRDSTTTPNCRRPCRGSLRTRLR